MSGFNIEMMSKVGAGRLDQISESNSISSQNDGDDAVGGGNTFGDLLKNALQDANKTQVMANNAAEELMAGRNKDLHGTMMAMEKADISFRLLTQVRNKVIDAYREVMKMQV